MMVGGGAHSRAENENMPAIGLELEKVARKPTRVKNWLRKGLIIRIPIFDGFSMILENCYVCRIFVLLP